MDNNDANEFAFNSFINAFLPGNEFMIDQYFDSDLILHNHSVSKNYNLNNLKSHLPNVYKKYKNIKSEIRDLIVDDNRLAFHVTQHTFDVAKEQNITVNIMNLYKLHNGKVKEWHMWENYNSSSE